MSMKKTYTCNICEEEIKDFINSLVVNFAGIKQFILGNYKCTDKIHICYGCAQQLKKSLMAIKDEILTKKGEQHGRKTAQTT